MNEKMYCPYSPYMSTFHCSTMLEKHEIVFPYSYRHDREAESAFFVKGPTIVSCGHKNECDCSNDGPLNIQIDKFDGSDGVALEDICVKKTIF